MKKIFHANGNKTKDGVAIYSHRQRRLQNKNKERHREALHNVKMPIQKEDITFINICGPSQHKSTKIHITNISKHNVGNQQLYNDRRGLYHSTFING